MSSFLFPALPLNQWKATRDSLQNYVQIISAAASEFIPHQKNWEEHSLKVTSTGLSTHIIPAPKGAKTQALAIELNLLNSSLDVTAGNGYKASISLKGQSGGVVAAQLKDIFNFLGIETKLNVVNFDKEENNEYDKSSVHKLLSILISIDAVLKTFKGTLLQETSSVQFWPHHFDLSMLLFTGRIIPGTDPNDWDNSREQLNFGFSTGDDSIPNPYFYVTAYPFPDAMEDWSLPGKAYWHKKGFQAAILSYSEIVDAEHPSKFLLDLFQKITDIFKSSINN